MSDQEHPHPHTHQTHDAIIKRLIKELVALLLNGFNQPPDRTRGQVKYQSKN